MAKKSPSKEEALRRAKEELGEETFAQLMALDPETRSAILIAGRPAGKNPGPVPGSGTDWAPWSLRIAEMMIDGERSERAASREAAVEHRTATGNKVDPDTLRKHYRDNRESLHASVLARRKEAASKPRQEAEAPSLANFSGLTPEQSRYLQNHWDEILKYYRDQFSEIQRQAPDLMELKKQAEARAREIFEEYAKLRGPSETLIDRWRRLSEESAAALRETILGLNSWK